jgi:DNA polymerase bacteriophage-type
MILYLDIETRGTRFKDGPHIYATEGGAHPILLQWAVDDGEVEVCEWSDPSISVLQELVHRANTVVVHNAEFDITLLVYNGVHVPGHKVHCTMAQAKAHGLPGELAFLCGMFHVEQGKAKLDGKRLIQLFCHPNSDGSYNDKDTHPAEWAEFREYARHDVLAMRELYTRMPHWNTTVERSTWNNHWEMIHRGFAVDIDLARALTAALAKDKARTDEAFEESTEGCVTSGTQRDRILSYLLDEHGVDLPDLTASTIERRINDESLPEAARELLRLRWATSKTSGAKFKTLLSAVSADGRLRGAKVYCGAARTGRWSGRKFQPDNLPRPTLTRRVIRAAVAATKTGALFLLDELPLPRMAAEMLRGVIVAPPGHQLLVADLASIEGRVLAWLAGEEWKLNAYWDRDAERVLFDLYVLAYARTFHVEPVTVTKAQRQLGKVIELMLGFGGGVGAFLTGCATYKVDVEQLVTAVSPHIPPEQLEESARARTWFLDTLHDKLAKSLPAATWIVLHALTRMWRRDNPAIVTFWDQLEEAFKLVQSASITSFTVGKHLRVERVGRWTRIRLPSGRYLCYPDVQLDAKGMTFAGVSPYTHKWGRVRTYGGKLAENVTQGVARDVLAAGIDQVCALGGHPVLHMHDELILEEQLDSTAWSLDRLIWCMTRFDKNHWTAGLPLAASGFATDRYYKEV